MRPGEMVARLGGDEFGVVFLDPDIEARVERRLAIEQRSDPTLQMHVNVSVQELVHGDLPEHVFAAIRAAGVRPETVTLEITENAIVDMSTGAGAVLERLRAGSVRVCVDDFGIGYSSLRYLGMLPISGIKIDRSFVSGHGADLASEPIVRMVLDLARSLGLDVVSEGIETAEQAAALRLLGCSTGQGFIFSPPLLPALDQPPALPPELHITRS
jgi:EAL domain-containing protein (putative c-di-GMP-specific phosphodiesterase class I)